MLHKTSEVIMEMSPVDAGGRGGAGRTSDLGTNAASGLEGTTAERAKGKEG